jgi:hypothetical protein
MPTKQKAMKKELPLVPTKAVSDRFTRITGDLALGVRDLINWGFDTGNTTPGEMRMTIAARDEAARAAIASGMSYRKTAKMLGCSVGTISNAVFKDNTESVQKLNTKTGSAATKAKRARIAASAAAGGVTVEPSDKYRIVYADPPWDYGTHAPPGCHTEAGDHYPVMPLEDICALPVKDWVEKDAVLFLWVTAPMLQKAFAVVEAWGFEYKAQFVWDKIKHNMGHYNSVRHEKFIYLHARCLSSRRQGADRQRAEHRARKAQRQTCRILRHHRDALHPRPQAGNVRTCPS